MASSLVIGQRIIPQIILRAADARPFEIQDLCPADNKFKVLLFAGDLAGTKQAQRLNRLAADMAKPEGFLSKFGRRRDKDGDWDVFNILTVCAAKKEMVNYLDVPKFLRPHWSKCVLPILTSFVPLLMVSFL
jgi:phenol 2-monooxygenase